MDMPDVDIAYGISSEKTVLFFLAKATVYSFECRGVLKVVVIVESEDMFYAGLDKLAMMFAMRDFVNKMGDLLFKLQFRLELSLGGSQEDLLEYKRGRLVIDIAHDGVGFSNVICKTSKNILPRGIICQSVYAVSNKKDSSHNELSTPVKCSD